MSEIVNLRRERKRRKSLDQARLAEANRALHGLTKARKQALALERRRGESVLDGARLEEGGTAKGDMGEGGEKS